MKWFLWNRFIGEWPPKFMDRRQFAGPPTASHAAGREL